MPLKERGVFVKHLFHVVGVVTLIVTALVLLNNTSIIKKGTDAAAADDNTTFAITCTGADVFFSPTSVTTAVQYNPSNPLGLIDATVTVTGSVAGGTANPTVLASGESTTPDWAYVVFGSPKLRHIYSCRGVTVTKSDLKWRWVADNASMYAGFAPTGTTSEAAFTRVTAVYADIFANKDIEAGKPFFTWDDAALNFIVKGSVAGSTTGGSTQSMDVTFQSTPKP